MARRLGVSRDDVVAAAVRTADQEGLEGLTVAAVAAEVGCRPPSVYHHVDGLDGLIRAVTFVAAEQLVSAMEATTDAGTPADVLREMVDVAHAWGVGHPARFDALRRPVGPDATPELIAARNQVLLPVHDVLIALGVPADQRPPLVAALVAAVRGCIAADLDADDGGSDPTLVGARAAGRDLLVQLLLQHIEDVARDPEHDHLAARADDVTRATT